MRRHWPLVLLLTLFLGWTGVSEWRAGATFAAASAGAAAPAEVPVKGMVTMVDLGAKTCIPCRMMVPILAELETEYRGRAAIVFIDIGKEREQAARFAVRAIPTQIFFDAAGKEVSRHEGFMDKAAIVSTLASLGVK